MVNSPTKWDPIGFDPQPPVRGPNLKARKRGILLYHRKWLDKPLDPTTLCLDYLGFGVAGVVSEVPGGSWLTTMVILLACRANATLKCRQPVLGVSEA